MAGHVATTGETLNITDAYHDERFNRYIALIEWTYKIYLNVSRVAGKPFTENSSFDKVMFLLSVGRLTFKQVIPQPHYCVCQSSSEESKYTLSALLCDHIILN